MGPAVPFIAVEGSVQCCSVTPGDCDASCVQVWFLYVCCDAAADESSDVFDLVIFVTIVQL